MPGLGRRKRGRFEDPPLLVIRFTVLTAIGLALAAAGILFVVRHLTTAQAEAAAVQHARFATQTVLADVLQPSDFDGPVSAVRRGTLDEFFRDHLLLEGTLRVELTAASGEITYSSDHSRIGAETADPVRLGEVLSGMIVSDVTDLEATERRATALRTYVPLALAASHAPGVVILYQDYVPIARAAEEAFFPVAGVFELALVGLYVALIPILRRVTRRIRSQMVDIRRMALQDDLTGLPNRRLFRDRVEQAILAAARQTGEVAVILLDLDRFKEINDTLGHQTGDRLLGHIAARIRGTLRADETFARLGGDEFGVLLPRATEASALEVARRIGVALGEPFLLGDLPVEVEASIGIALFPRSGTDVDQLVQRADVAMYLSKETHSGYTLYDTASDPNDPQRLALVGELRRAMAERELVLFFQPVADLHTGAVRRVEALLRWQHPERGLLAPAEFIPSIERTGLVRPLTAYVLESALRQQRAWRLAGADVVVAVNVVMQNLLDPSFPGYVARLLGELGVRADSLQLEITESTIMRDPFRVGQVLDALSKMGVGLAVDDYGTGYSSLAYLKRLPVDMLKIDRSFVSQMTTDQSDAAIVRSTVELGRNLGLAVVAEGVETREIWLELGRLGCTFAQGHYVGSPVPASELAARLGWSSAGSGSRQLRMVGAAR